MELGGGGLGAVFHRLKHTQQFAQLCLGFLFFQRREKKGRGGWGIARWLSTVEAAATPGIVRLVFDHLSSEILPLDLSEGGGNRGWEDWKSDKEGKKGEDDLSEM